QHPGDAAIGIGVVHELVQDHREHCALRRGALPPAAITERGAGGERDEIDLLRVPAGRLVETSTLLGEHAQPCGHADVFLVGDVHSTQVLRCKVESAADVGYVDPVERVHCLTALDGASDDAARHDAFNGSCLVSDEKATGCRMAG